MAVSSYPDKSGLVESLARPGGNVTGLSNLRAGTDEQEPPVSEGDRALRCRVWLCSRTRGTRSRCWRSRKSWPRRPGARMDIQSIEVRTPDDYAAAFASGERR